MLCWLAAIVITGLLLWGFYWVAIKSGEKALAEDAAHAKKLSDQRKLKRVQQYDPLNKERPLISLVMLFNDPRYIDEASIRAAAQRAWGVTIPEDTIQADDWVISAGPAGHFLLRVGGVLSQIINKPAPFFANVTQSADALTQKIITENRASVSFEWKQSGSETRDQDHVYRLLAKLIVEFADATCLGVHDPDANRFYSLEQWKQIAHGRGQH